jgi:N-acetylmuramoyl-L-alanine amidase
MNIIDVGLKFNSRLNARTNTNMVILHHAAASKCSVQDVHRWHLNKGWAGIGYHYFVSKDGQIYRGRPEHTEGAHTLGYNGVSIGICSEGNYQVESMPEVQKQAIIALCQDIKNRLGVSTFKGHGELAATSCPGVNYPLGEVKMLINATSWKWGKCKIGVVTTRLLPLLVRDGNGRATGKKLSKGTSWQVWGERNGMYNVGGDEWVSKEYMRVR